MAIKKTFREKMHYGKEPYTQEVPESMQGSCGTGLMLIPQPWQIEALIHAIPAGQVATLSDLRAELAQRYQANVTCPLVSGIAWSLTAKAAEEDPAHGAPWWRVVKSDGALNPKLPGGAERHKEMLLSEGIKFNARGNRVDLDGTKRADFSQVPINAEASAPR